MNKNIYLSVILVIFPSMILPSSILFFDNWLLSNFSNFWVAGTSFGKYGEGYIRLSCANSDTAIEEAISRIKNFFN